MPRPLRILAIDLGTRRIGVAVTDALGLTAQPLATIERHGGKRDLDAIAEVVRKYQVETIVLGFPQKSRMEKNVSGFAERLRQTFDMPIELVDESFTTVEAEALLVEADLSRKRRKEVVDRVAAALILQRWLGARDGG